MSNYNWIIADDTMRALNESYAPKPAPDPDQEYLDRLAGWCIKMRLKINDTMEQALIDKMGRQLAGKDPREQKEVLERWADAYVFEQLAGLFERDRQSLAKMLCEGIVSRLRYPDRHPRGMEHVACIAVGLAAAYPRYRHIIEGLYLATEDVLYEIATLFGDENEVPFSSEENSKE